MQKNYAANILFFNLNNKFTQAHLKESENFTCGQIINMV